MIASGEHRRSRTAVGHFRGARLAAALIERTVGTSRGIRGPRQARFGGRGASAGAHRTSPGGTAGPQRLLGPAPARPWMAERSPRRPPGRHSG